MRKLLFYIILFGIAYTNLVAQPSVGIGTDTPNPSSILDITSSEKGVLIPRMTTVDRNTNLGALIATDAGLLIYNTTDAAFNYWNGTAWIVLPGSDNDWDRNNTFGFLYPTTLTDNVGIGTNTPADKLVVTGGRVEITDNNLANGNTGTGSLEIANTMRLSANDIITNPNVTLNLQGSNNSDLDVDNGTLRVSALNNRVGINETAPDNTLDVVGDIDFTGNFTNQEILGVHSGTAQSVPFTNLAFTPLTGTTVSITIDDGNGINNSAVLITGFARVFGGNLVGNPSSVGGYFMVLERALNPAFTGAAIVTYTSGACYIETPNGAVSAAIGYGGGGHISYVENSLTQGVTYYYRLTLVPNSVGITGGTFDVYQRDLNILQIKR